MKKILIFVIAYLSIYSVSAQELNDTTVSVYGGEAPLDRITFVNTDELNDFENVFTHEEELELKKVMYNNKKFIFSIVTTNSYDPYLDIQQYTYAFGQSLPFNKTNLVVISLSKNKQGFFILSGPKVQTVLTSQKTKEIIDNIIVPEFQDGDFFLGIKNGIIAISQLENK